MPESSPTPLLSPRAALRLCAALLAGLAVVVLVALAERPRAVVLEDFSQTTDEVLDLVCREHQRKRTGSTHDHTTCDPRLSHSRSLRASSAPMRWWCSPS